MPTDHCGRSGAAAPLASGSTVSYNGSMDRPFEQMSAAEKILYVQDLWDRIAEHPEDVPITPKQREELRRRLDAFRANPADSVDWAVAREAMRQRR